VAHFTEREMDVIHCLPRGLSNKEIAGQLEISARTVNFHLGAIYEKCGFGYGSGNRVKLVAFAFRNGLVK